MISATSTAKLESFEHNANKPCAHYGCDRPRHRAKSGRCYTSYCKEHYSKLQRAQRPNIRSAVFEERDPKVKALMLEGYAMKEIAHRVGMSRDLANHSIRRILKAAGVRTQLQYLAQEIKRLRGQIA